MKQLPPEPNNCNGCIPSGCQPKKCNYCEACQDLAVSIEPTIIIYVCIALVILTLLWKANKK